MPIGQWQEHLPGLPAIAVTVSTDKVYCATAWGLFSVTTGEEQDITRYSKVNGLNDIGISAIGSNNGTILIAYRNSNLDLLMGNHIYNIPEILRKQVPADKSIYRIFFYNDRAMLCTGLGIVVVNTTNREISDTYITGNNGAYTPVYAIATQGAHFYAATAAGIKRGALTGSNLADYRNWEPVQQGLQNDTVQQVIQVANRLICRQGNQLYRLENDHWQPWYTGDRQITDMAVQGQQLLVCQQQPGTGARVIVLDENGSLVQTLQDPYLQAPMQAAGNGPEIWIADSLQGLIRYNGSGYTPVKPNAPSGIITGDLLFINNTLCAAAGTVSNTWQATGNTGGYYTFSGREWQQYNKTALPYLDTIKDIITLAADPAGNGIYAGSFGGGLLHLRKDGSHVLYKQGTLPAATDNAQAYQVSGLATDAAGNLWLAAYGASRNLLLKKPDNTWLSFRNPYAQTGNAISQLLTDDAGQVWMVSPQGNGLFVMNHNNTPENMADDQWRQYRMGAAQGNLPSNDVYCIAKDKNGSIWIGTGRGIAIINCAAQALSAACNAWLPVIKQDNFAGYLFQDEQVYAIATDGADRKWVGTGSGAWLVNATGDMILEHFNTANSPLPDNHIYKIAIDPVSGEVFFATGRGVMSWRSTATEGGNMHKDEVLAFPNPVPPGYNGIIAIRGLVSNALVKITDISGKLVFQARAQGGQAVWNGRDYTGHRPQSGVYLVFATGEEGGEQLVTKIVFIN